MRLEYVGLNLLQYFINYCRIDLGEKISKDEFCSDDVKSTLAKWAAEPVDDMEAGT